MLEPLLDLAPITRMLRAKASSNLLVVAVHHLKVFEILAGGPQSLHSLQIRLGLQTRPAMVLFPALCAMGLLEYNTEHQLRLTALGQFLCSSCEPNMIGYTGLEKDDPGVLRTLEYLRHDGPAEEGAGVSYVKDEQAASPMDDPESALFFTMALAGRARYLAPLVAARMGKRKGHLLDIAGGSGYYTYEWLLANPSSRATIIDTPEVLKVSAKLLDEFCASDHRAVNDLKQRVSFLPGDMLTDTLPVADVVLAASVFHDWPESTCAMLAKKFAGALSAGGELWIHEAFLNDSLDGPLAVTDYSTMLFLGTRGRAYSRREYQQWLIAAGLQPSVEIRSTLLDYGLLSARKAG